LTQGSLVTCENRDANPIDRDCELPIKTGKGCASCKANEIVGIGHLLGLVEVVYAPNQTTFGVSPSAEVLDVGVANA
jgi:hypothetical protein